MTCEGHVALVGCVGGHRGDELVGVAFSVTVSVGRLDMVIACWATHERDTGPLSVWDKADSRRGDEGAR